MKELFAVIFIVLFLVSFNSLGLASSSSSLVTKATKGEIEVIVSDKIALNEENMPIIKESKIEYFLIRDTNRIPLILPCDSPPPYPGQKAKIFPDGALKYYDPKFMPAEKVIGEKKIAVALIKPSGENPSNSKQDVEKILETTKEFLESSHQHSKITVPIQSAEDWEESEKTIDEYRDEESHHEMNRDQMLEDAIKSLDDSVNFKEIDCLFIIIADESRPFKWSSSTLGYDGERTTADGICKFGIVYTGVRNLMSKGLASHELGHVLLRLFHAAAAKTTEGDVGNCYNLGEVKEYNNLFDVMGSGFGFFSLESQMEAGWLEAERVKIVSNSITLEIRLRELELKEGTQLVKIISGYDAEGNEEFYTVELYKKEYEDFNYYNNIEEKALLLLKSHEGGWGEGGGYDSVLFHEEEYSTKPYLQPGEEICGLGEKGNISIKYVSLEGEGEETVAEVEINFYCPEEISPTVSVYSEQIAIVAGQSLTADVSVQNTMAVGCGTHTYSLKAELPENWTADFEKSSLDIKPNGTETARVLVNSPADASPGSYELKFIATDATDGSLALTGEGILNVLVMPAPPSPPPLPSPPPIPTPSPTPSPTSTVSTIKLDSEKINGSGNLILLRKGESCKVSAEVLAEGGFGDIPIPNVAIKARVHGKGAKKVSISPSSVLSGRNGTAEFIITAKRKGNAKIFFTAQNIKKILIVKVK